MTVFDDKFSDSLLFTPTKYKLKTDCNSRLTKCDKENCMVIKVADKIVYLDF